MSKFVIKVRGAREFLTKITGQDFAQFVHYTEFKSDAKFFGTSWEARAFIDHKVPAQAAACLETYEVDE